MGSFAGMVSSNEYLIGAVTGNKQTAEAAANWVDAAGSVTGLAMLADGSKPAEAAQGSGSTGRKTSRRHE